MVNMNRKLRNIGVRKPYKNIEFGKYKGKTWKYATLNDPSYIFWCNSNLKFFEFSRVLLYIAGLFDMYHHWIYIVARIKYKSYWRSR